MSAIIISASRTTAGLKARGIAPVFDPETVRVSPEEREREREFAALSKTMQARRLEAERMERERAERQAMADRQIASLDAWFKTAANYAPQKLTIAKIIRRFAGVYGVSVSDIKGPSRKSDILIVRMAAMYWIRRRLGTSYPEIGRRFGNRDHATALNAVRVYPRRRARMGVTVIAGEKG